MKRTVASVASALLVVLSVVLTYAALVVPTDVQQPGTQPLESRGLESPDKCDNCHGGYNTAIEPAHTWRGSMMAQATRDPIFWATVAVAEQDFDGVGDLCLRCHTPEGWLGGRSTPTDGSALAAGDADGVSCDLCHKMTNPDNSEWAGFQVAPFVANSGGATPIGYYGGGMYSIWPGTDKLGPYADAAARHKSLPSQFHRQASFCGTCHDVSNPAVGDLAHNNGRQPTSGPVIASGVPGAPVTAKAAFKNFPFQYGIVERTFSEHAASQLSRTLVSDYSTLPADLRAGAIKAAYDSAGGRNYQDGTNRYFSCQSCHLRPVTGQGCNKNPAVRNDLPLHDMTGGNYWIPDAIQYLSARGQLRVGSPLTANQIAALKDGQIRALKQLSAAAALSVSGNTLKIVNLTGHKLISGYPEGRRMWLNAKWYDASDRLIREDGRYGPITVTLNGTSMQVKTILDPVDPNTKIYEAHYAMTQEWARQLLDLGYSPTLALTYDRATAAVTTTLSDLAAQPPGTSLETFHFVLNNTVAKDNRIPPYGMRYEEARTRNALPVPPTQYGNPTGAASYNYWDSIALNPPSGAAYARIDLLYQPTSWEYVQFLYLANSRQNSFLANEGSYLLDAWLNTGMAEPYVMTSAEWGTPPAVTLTAAVDRLTTWSVSKSGSLLSPSSTFSAGATVGVEARVIDGSAKPVSGAQVYLEIRTAGGTLATTLQAFSDAAGSAVAKWKTERGQASGAYHVAVVGTIKSGYTYTPHVTSATFTIQ